MEKIDTLSFGIGLFTAQYIPDTVQSVGDRKINKTIRSPTLIELKDQ